MINEHQCTSLTLRIRRLRLPCQLVYVFLPTLQNDTKTHLAKEIKLISEQGDNFLPMSNENKNRKLHTSGDSSSSSSSSSSSDSELAVVLLLVLSSSWLLSMSRSQCGGSSRFSRKVIALSMATGKEKKFLKNPSLISNRFFGGYCSLSMTAKDLQKSSFVKKS